MPQGRLPKILRAALIVTLVITMTAAIVAGARLLSRPRMSRFDAMHRQLQHVEDEMQRRDREIDELTGTPN